MKLTIPMVLIPATLDITIPEEMETEKKFDDGMLGKLSKITDLMSRLETYMALLRVTANVCNRPLLNIVMSSFINVYMLVYNILY